MKLVKSDLSNALKRLSIFVSKEKITEYTSLVRFYNINGRAQLFATDIGTAGKVYIQTGIQDEFEFCIEFNQLLQATKIRNKEISVEKFTENEEGEKFEGILFSDDKTRFEFPLRESAELVDLLNKNVLPEEPSNTISAKVLKDAIASAGYARSDKDVQNIALTGVCLALRDGQVMMSSTDRSRIAMWKTEMTVDKDEDAILSSKAVSSILLFDDDDMIEITIDTDKVIFRTEDFEAYTTVINAEYPDLSRFFTADVSSSYKLNKADVLESLSIVGNDDTLRVEFKGNSLHLSTSVNNAICEDFLDCEKLSGNDEVLHLSTKYFTDVMRAVGDEVVVEFRGSEPKLFAYSSGDYYGMIAPKRVHE